MSQMIIEARESFGSSLNRTHPSWLSRVREIRSRRSNRNDIGSQSMTESFVILQRQSYCVQLRNFDDSGPSSISLSDQTFCPFSKSFELVSDYSFLVSSSASRSEKLTLFCASPKAFSASKIRPSAEYLLNELTPWTNFNSRCGREIAVLVLSKYWLVKSKVGFASSMTFGPAHLAISLAMHTVGNRKSVTERNPLKATMPRQRSSNESL